MSEESGEKVQRSLRKNLSKPSYETWILPTEFSDFKNGELILERDKQKRDITGHL